MTIPQRGTASDARWRRVRELFDALVELAPAERAELLARECGADEELRRELEALLESAEREDGFLTPRAGAPGVAHETAASATRLGPLALGPTLGSGRFGRVHRARARDGRELALRLVPIEGGDAESVPRLRRLAPSLQTLAHPGLARVLEAGLGVLPETQRPALYFASELVPSPTALAAHAVRVALGPRARLALFREACLAVAHAHAHGLAHGRLSAANLVVDATGVRILDLGVAAVVAPGTSAPDDVAALGARLAELFTGALDPGDPLVEAVRTLGARASDPRRCPASVERLLAELPAS